MIGVKSATAVGLAAIAAAVATWRGRLAIDHLATLGPSSCFAIGLLAGLATALIAVGVRPRLASRLAIGWREVGQVHRPGAEVALRRPFELGHIGAGRRGRGHRGGQSGHRQDWAIHVFSPRSDYWRCSSYEPVIMLSAITGTASSDRRVSLPLSTSSWVR